MHGGEGKADGSSCAPSIGHSIWVRDLRVVDDPVLSGPGGAFSLRETVAGVARGGVSPELTLSATLPKLLDLCPYTVPSTSTFEPSYGVHCDPNPPYAAGALRDLDELPAKLVGIVNRVDFTTAEEPSGELRLLYQIFPIGSSPAPARDPAPSSGNPTVRDSNAPSAWLLNFEFDLAAVRDEHGRAIPRRVWAARWAALADLELGSTAYNDALAQIVRLVTRRGAAPGRPNGSALRRLRISLPNWNYGRFADSMWRISSRQLDSDGTLVAHSPLDNTPVNSWNNLFTTPYGTPGSLVSYLVSNERQVLAGTNELPTTGPLAPGLEVEAQEGGGAYLGSMPFERTQLPNDWTRPRFDAVVSAFSKRTCDGCHGAPGTKGVQAWRRRDSEPAELSAFLTAELPRRAEAVGKLVCGE